MMSRSMEWVACETEKSWQPENHGIGTRWDDLMKGAMKLDPRREGEGA